MFYSLAKIQEILWIVTHQDFNLRFLSNLGLSKSTRFNGIVHCVYFDLSAGNQHSQQDKQGRYQKLLQAYAQGLIDLRGLHYHMGLTSCQGSTSIFFFVGDLCSQQDQQERDWTLLQAHPKGPRDQCGPYHHRGLYVQVLLQLGYVHLFKAF